MKKTRIYHICDRCKKEIKDEEINNRFQSMYCYELCDECKDLFDEYMEKIREIQKKFDELSEEYKFADYLPKDNLESKGE